MHRLLFHRTVLWCAVCPDRPVLLVIVRDPDEVEPGDFFFTTDLTMTPTQVVHHYAGRWSTEDTFGNVKQFPGGQQPQSWKHQCPERAAAGSASKGCPPLADLGRARQRDQENARKD